LKLAVTASATMLALSLAACAADNYEAYMADGCDGLGQMVSAHSEGDPAGVEAGFTATGAFTTASEEAAGDVGKRAEVATVSGARSALFSATFEAPENNDGDLVPKPKELTREQQRSVDEAIAICERY
jgi:hypothetical protein